VTPPHCYMSLLPPPNLNTSLTMLLLHFRYNIIRMKLLTCSSSKNRSYPGYKFEKLIHRTTTVCPTNRCYKVFPLLCPTLIVISGDRQAFWLATQPFKPAENCLLLTVLYLLTFQSQSSLKKLRASFLIAKR